MPVPSAVLEPLQFSRPLSTLGNAIDSSPEHFGPLLPSDPGVQSMDELRSRMERDGYLYMPGLLHREQVLEARREIAKRLQAKGNLLPGTDIMECRPNQGMSSFSPDVARNNPPLEKVLYDGPMMDFFRGYLGGPVRHFDYTWLRTLPPGGGTAAHTDAVYMNRGTLNLFTAWVPIGDISIDLGGLMILEGSHLEPRIRKTYSMKDADSYCENRVGKNYTGLGGGGNIRRNGALSENPDKLRQAIGGRWLTANFRAGDALVFSIFTIHASLDNRGDEIRISSDSRYQRADEPADERWIGDDPIGHGPAAKRAMIC